MPSIQFSIEGRSKIHPTGRPPLRAFALQFYRFAVVATIAWLIRDVAVRQRIQGDSPVTAAEIVSFLPGAATLRPDDSARDGLFALDRDWKILGLTIHSSEDTESYIKDITVDRRFLKKWNGLTWDAAAALDLKAAGIEGVSGSTMTSMAIAQSVKARLQLSRDQLAARVPLRFAWRDYALLAVIAAAGLMAFGPPAVRHRWKRPYQFVLIVYVGLIAGDLLAQKLLVGWTRSGIPWTTAPGLVLLAAAALLVPLATGKPLYCHHVCPHGAAQELLSHYRPARFQITLSASVIRGLEYLPFALVFFTLAVALLALPFDLAGLEPFAAYVIRSAGVATLAVAAVGLIASFFVPQAYCRFGCPTGALLNFVRARGPTDRFSRRDYAALALVALAVALHAHHLTVLRWVQVGP